MSTRFRMKYKEAAKIRAFLPNETPILGLTATAFQLDIILNYFAPNHGHSEVNQMTLKGHSVSIVRV